MSQGNTLSLSDLYLLRYTSIHRYIEEHIKQKCDQTSNMIYPFLFMNLRNNVNVKDLIVYSNTTCVCVCGCVRSYVCIVSICVCMFARLSPYLQETDFYWPTPSATITVSTCFS